MSFLIALAAAAFAAGTGDFYYATEDAPEPKQVDAPVQPAKAAPPAKPTLTLETAKILEEGRYKLTVTGVICNACTLQIVTELQRIPGVAAKFSFDEGVLHLTVAKPQPKKDKDGKPLPQPRWRAPRVSQILRAVRHAGRKSRLGVEFKVTSLEKAG